MLHSVRGSDVSEREKDTVLGHAGVAPYLFKNMCQILTRSRPISMFLANWGGVDSPILGKDGYCWSGVG